MDESVPLPEQMAESGMKTKESIHSQIIRMKWLEEGISFGNEG